MPSPLALAIFILGLAVSLYGSEVLVRAVQRVGRALEFSAGLVGLLIALGADSPEISSAVTALLSGAHDVGLGVIVGSNLFNLAVLLGLSAVVAGQLTFGRAVLVLDGSVAVLTTLVILLLIAGLAAPLVLVLMLLVFLPYAALLSVQPRRIDRLPVLRPLRDRLAILARLVHSDPGTSEPAHGRGAAWWIPVAILAIVGGSYAMVTAALTLGDRWHVSHFLLGTVILAALTSLPNAYAALRLALGRNGAAVVSEAFNSNTLNLLAGISVPAVFIGLTATPGAFAGLVWLLAMTLLAIILGAVRQQVNRPGGLLLILCYGAFLIVSLR